MRGTPAIHLLYGFPGVGKLTIANEMVGLLGASGHEVRLVDNHVINNQVFRLIEQDGLTPLPPVVWERHPVRLTVESTPDGEPTSTLSCCCYWCFPKIRATL